MNPLVSTILSILFLIVGGIAVAMMLSVQGRGKLQNPKLVIRIHKAMGWTYVVLFFVLFFFMLGRIGSYWEESSARIALHVALSVGLFFLLIVKVIIPRSFPRLGKHLFSLGIAAYFLGFVLVGITGGYYLLRVFRETPYISHTPITVHMQDLELGKELFITRCSTCHSLDKIMNFRSAENWTDVVNEMMKLAEPRIKPGEMEQILYYLSETHVPKPFEGPPEATLLDRHCLPCHDASDIMKHSYTRVGWLEITRQMNLYDPDIVPEDKIGEIVDYLIEYQHIE